MCDNYTEYDALK